MKSVRTINITIPLYLKPVIKRGKTFINIRLVPDVETTEYEVEQIVGAYLGVTLRDIIGNGRKEAFVEARYISIYIRELLGQQPKQINPLYLSGMPIYNMRKYMDARMATEPEFVELVQKLKKLVFKELRIVNPLEDGDTVPIEA